METFKIIVDLMSTFSSLGALPFAILFVFFTRAVKGSRERFIFNSYCRALQWPALVWGPSATVDNLLTGDTGWALVTTLAGYFYTDCVLRYRRESKDEDDIWRKGVRKAKRLTAKIKAKLHVPMPAVAPAMG